jgi:hypothetical protein
LGSVQEHLSKAADNEVFADGLDRGAPISAGWAVTALFYSAVHLIQACLVAKGKNPSTHSVRDSAIRRDVVLRAIYADYREMESSSRIARYETVLVTGRDVLRVHGCLSRIKALAAAHVQ